MKDKHIVAVAEAIRYHLYRWPDASGTAMEIAGNWIPHTSMVAHETVLAALAQLEAQGFVERKHSGNALLWQLRRNGDDGSAA